MLRIITAKITAIANRAIAAPSSPLFERSLMWISHSIAEEIRDAEENNS
jgi:hypothetical protein